MLNRHATHAAALGLAAAFLVSCSDVPLVAPGLHGPALLESGDVADSVVIWPSYERYELGMDAMASGAMMSLQAAAAQPDIRIGVVEQASAIHLGATGAWTMRDRANGVIIMTGNGGSARVTLASVSESFMSLQVMCSSAAAVSTRRAAAEALGHPTFTMQIPACTRLYIGRFPLGTAWGTRNAYRNLLISQGLAATDSFWPIPGITIGGGTMYRVVHGADTVENVNPVMVTADDAGHVTIGTSVTSFRRYRGTADARINSAGTLAGINELPMEQYLYGVVPRELGPSLYPELEAQKAQAVAARTYAIRGLNKRFADGYDLRATTSDQVYGGFQDEHPVSNAAIDATAGVVATYGGSPIDALFSSASGGHTSDSEEAYANAIPYLRGIPDAERGAAVAHVPTLEVFRAHANPTSLRNVKEGDFETDARINRHRWTYEWTAAEIREAMRQWQGRDVGNVLAINVLERGPSGRVLRVQYVTETDTLVQVKDAIRSSLRYVNASGTYSSLPSTLFFVEPVKEKGELTGGFRVYGGGFGHGVGLSQTGAVGMASKGHSYEEILHHYYQGITLNTMY